MESVGSLLLPPAQQPLFSTGRSLNHQTAAFVPKNTREEKESKLSGRNSPRVSPMALLQPQGPSLSSAWATKTMSLCPPCPQAPLKATASATSGGLWHRRLAVQVTFDPARCCDSDQQPEQVHGAPTTPESEATTGWRRTRRLQQSHGEGSVPPAPRGQLCYHQHLVTSTLQPPQAGLVAMPPLSEVTAVTEHTGSPARLGFPEGLGRKDKGRRRCSWEEMELQEVRSWQGWRGERWQRGQRGQKGTGGMAWGDPAPGAGSCQPDSIPVPHLSPGVLANPTFLSGHSSKRKLCLVLL